MLHTIAKIQLKSKIHRNNALRKKQFYNWNNIQKIALIIGNQDVINKSLLDTFIEQLQTYTEVFFIETNSKTPSYSDWHCFAKENKSALGLPKKVMVDALQNKKFDLVIDAAKGYEIYSAAIAAYIHAPLNCGTQNWFEQHDLIIHRTENQDLLPYLNEVVKYLKMIKTG